MDEVIAMAQLEVLHGRFLDDAGVLPGEPKEGE
jgi:hypothetical protein